MCSLIYKTRRGKLPLLSLNAAVTGSTHQCGHISLVSLLVAVQNSVGHGRMTFLISKSIKARSH